MLQAANVQQVLQDIKASNQMAQFLGNKVEMAITKAVEGNKSLLKVGLHFEFGDCRYVLKYLFQLVLYVSTYLQIWNHIFFHLGIG